MTFIHPSFGMHSSRFGNGARLSATRSPATVDLHTQQFGRGGEEGNELKFGRRGDEGGESGTAGKPD